jgi:hypothetical protein
MPIFLPDSNRDFTPESSQNQGYKSLSESFMSITRFIAITGQQGRQQ